MALCERMVEVKTGSVDAAVDVRARPGWVWSLTGIWRTVSGAKFNIEKTKIIPVGFATHRREVIKARKIIQPRPHPTPRSYPNRKRRGGSPNDGHGAVPSRKPNPIATLSSTKSKRALKLKIRPTTEGKSQIIQATVGGLTRLLTQTHDMPKHMEDALDNIINDYMGRQE